MMRIFQTFWTKPMDEDRLRKNVYIAALSLRYAQKSGYYVVMYTDSVGYELLKDLGYDEINTYLDNIPEDVNPSQFFAYPKFFAGLKEELGSLHTDFDVFLKKPCVNIFFEDKTIDIILQCEEYHQKEYEKNCKVICEHEYPEILKIKNMHYSSNVGIIGFNNKELKEIYYSWYFDYIDFYKTKLTYIKNCLSELISEQVNINYLIKTKKYNCYYLLPIDNDIYEERKKLNVIANKIGYQHLQGGCKYNESNFLEIKTILKYKFPETYNLVKKNI